MSNIRIVLCEACGSEGRFYVDNGHCDRQTGEPMLAEEPCPWCEGTGGELIAVQPIDMDDLDVMSGEVAS